MNLNKWIPWIVSAVLLAWVASNARPPRSSTANIKAFGQLPALANGRLQPLDSLARNSLLQLREKQSIYLNDEKRRLSASEWLMDMFMNPAVADKRPTFRIDHPELKSLLKLPEPTPGDDTLDGKHFSWNLIKPSLDEIRQQARRINDIPAKQRNAFERAVWTLQSRMFLYMRLQNTLQPQDAQDWPADLQAYLQSVDPGLAAFRAQRAGQPHDEEALSTFSGFAGRFDAMKGMEPPLVIPPDSPTPNHDGWQRTGEALFNVIYGEALPQPVRHYASMAGAYRSGNAQGFHEALTGYQAWLAQAHDKALRKASAEWAFNLAQPFYNSLVLYVVAFLFACSYWFNLSGWTRRSAFFLIVLAFLIHTAGLITRMMLEGRPPVTNLYSSAIFIGWGAVVLGMVLERFYRDSIGLVVASTTGFLSLIIAHNLAMGGDTMQMMEAVLDTNFWLATHVVIVTLGYASTYVAGFLAIIYVLRGIFTRTLSEATGKALARMAYGIICFATLFSFVGTVLGGIWADQSWGRFWGWDPKENGALIIVLWNALILHARWGGMVRERGLMNMALVGNIITSWSWFGVNMLEIGLHSYGFMDETFTWLSLFVGSQLLLIGLGLLPKSLWASFRHTSSSARTGKPVPEPAK